MASVPVAYAETAEVLPKKTLLTKSDIQSLVEFYSNKHELTNKKQSELLATILCEAPKSKDGLYDVTGQSRYINKTGEREQSFGLPQIHLPSHPNISKAQAIDADWSVDWSAEQFSNGKETMWTCYKDLKASGRI